MSFKLYIISIKHFQTGLSGRSGVREVNEAIYRAGGVDVDKVKREGKKLPLLVVQKLVCKI